MYTIYVSFICHEGKREAFVERMKSEGVLQAVREEDGCIRYDYYYADENPNELLLIEAYGVWQEKKMCGKVSMGVVRTTFIIDENGNIEKIMPKVKPDTNAADILAEL